ncbi:MAG: PKD domain-containing protein [Bacteroidota bacterium]|nr:PKD domain-containing protein [Bacteroidota bacterium]
MYVTGNAVTSGLITSSDYNNLYVSGNRFGTWGSNDAFRFSTWKSISGKDSNSISANPQFTSESDLSTNAIVLNGKAKPWSGITEDFESESRHTVTPDIGADEFTPQANDLMVVDLLTPQTGNCGNSATPIGVIIQNNGTASQSNFTVASIVSGAAGANLSQNYPGTLASGVIDTFFFTTTLNTSGGGEYTMTGYVSLSGDTRRNNDTGRAVFRLQAIPQAPQLTDTAVCKRTVVKLTASAPGGEVRWYTSQNSDVPVYTGETFSVTADSTRTYYAESSYAKAYTMGPVNNSIGSGGYTQSRYGIIFNVFEDMTIDSVAIYAGNTGNVAVELVDNKGNILLSDTFPVNQSFTKLYIPLDFKITPGSGYILYLDNIGSTVSLYRNTSGAKYPYRVANVVTITGNTFANGNYYYYFYDWHIRSKSCPSERMPVKVIVSSPPTGATLVKGSRFDGKFNNGTLLSQDVVCTGQTIVYSLTPPAGYNNADYGTTWTISSVTITTPKGLQGKTLTIADPLPIRNGSFTFVPHQSMGDSTLLLSIVLKDLKAGCDSTLTRYIYVSPVPIARVSASKTTVCVNEPVTFTSTSIPGRGVLTYMYHFGDGNRSTQAGPVYAYSAPGTYQAKLVVTNSNGCMDSVTQSIVVTSPPVADFTALTGCGSFSVTFDNNSAGATGYVWNFGDGNTSTDENPVHLYANEGTYQALLTITNASGCTDTSLLTIDVRQQPEADFTAEFVCEGRGTVFSNLTQHGGALAEYRWYFGDGRTSTQKDPTHIYLTDGKYMASLVVETPNGCKDSIARSVTVLETPTAAFTVPGGGCREDTVTFLNTSSTINGSPASYTWDFGDGTVQSNEIHPVHAFMSYGTYKVTLMVINGSGCQSSVTNNVKVLPPAEFSAPDACDGQPMTFFNVTVSEPGDVNSYVWDFDDGDSSTAQNPTHLYAEPGTYDVRLIVTSIAGCTDIVLRRVTVHEIPEPAFFISATENTVTFIPEETTSGTYLWEFGDGDTSTAKSPVHTYATKGDFTATLTFTNANGCTGKSSQTFNVNDVGINEPARPAFSLDVYPNPFHENVTFRYTLEAPSRVSIRLYDMSGKEVAVTDKGMQGTGDHTETIDTRAANLLPGAYLARFMIDDKVVTKRIIKVE